MLMSDDKALCALLAQTDRLLVDRQRLRVDYLRAEQAQKQMISNISHDIKTPLTVILGYLEMARLRGEQGRPWRRWSARPVTWRRCWISSSRLASWRPETRRRRLNVSTSVNCAAKRRWSFMTA